MGLDENAMQRDWDARAKENPMYYIDTDKKDWDIEEFYASGSLYVYDLVPQALERTGFDPKGKRILEIGCGMGRFFPAFADFFDEIWGIDISPEMIRLGKAHCPVKDAKFMLGNGEDLSEISASSIDCCFSYIVFRHIPKKSLLWQYLAEIYRVLAPGGVFQLHFHSSEPIKLKVYSSIPRSLISVVAPVYHRAYLKLVHGESMEIPGSLSTWYGNAVSPREVERRLSGLGFKNVEILPDSTHAPGENFWAIGVK